MDFGDVFVELAGKATKCHLLVLRMSYSGKAVHRIFRSCGQKALKGTCTPSECLAGGHERRGRPVPPQPPGPRPESRVAGGTQCADRSVEHPACHQAMSPTRPSGALTPRPPENEAPGSPRPPHATPNSVPWATVPSPNRERLRLPCCWTASPPNRSAEEAPRDCPRLAELARQTALGRRHPPAVRALRPGRLPPRRRRAPLPQDVRRSSHGTHRKHTDHAPHRKPEVCRMINHSPIERTDAT